MDRKLEFYLIRTMIHSLRAITLKEIISGSNDMVINVNVHYSLKGNHTILFDKTYHNSYSERRITNELKRFLYLLQRRR